MTVQPPNTAGSDEIPANAALATACGAALWYYEERAEDARQEAERSVHAAQKRAVIEQQVRDALEQATKLRGALQEQLQQPGGVFALLNDASRWEGQLKEARAEVKRAKALGQSVEGGIDPALGAQLQAVDAALHHDDLECQLALQLDKIQLDKSTWVEGGFDYGMAAREYPKTFALLQLDAEQEEPATVAAS